jgi:hypothetical protein
MAAGSVTVPADILVITEIAHPQGNGKERSVRSACRSIRIEGGKEEAMKRIRLLVLLGMVAIALPLGLLQGIAKATGTSGTTNYVSINQYADYDIEGTFVDLGLQVTCKDPSKKGNVKVHVSQYDPETPYPIAEADGTQLVVCDGRSHYVTVSAFGGVFDGGTAKATAQLFTVSSGIKPVAKAARWIIIRHV